MIVKSKHYISFIMVYKAEHLLGVRLYYFKRDTGIAPAKLRIRAAEQDRRE